MMWVKRDGYRKAMEEFIDIDSTAEGATKYTDVKEQKEKQAVTDPNAYAVWGYGKLGDVVYSGSALAASLTAYTDAVNGDIPNVSPSNKTLSIGAICLADGTEIMLADKNSRLAPRSDERKPQGMALVYAALIQKGLKTIDDVPARIRAEVEALLAEQDHE